MLPAGMNGPYPIDTFISHSSDGSLRFWKFEDKDTRQSVLFSATESKSKRGGIAKELLEVRYIDEDWSEAVKTIKRCIVFSIYAFHSLLASDANIGSIAVAEVPVVGVRALAVSPDGNYIAAGDRCGNLRYFRCLSFCDSFSVHRFSDFHPIVYHEAHDSEILSVDFSSSSSPNGDQFFINFYLMCLRRRTVYACVGK